MLLGAVAFGILDVMAGNKDAFQYSTANVPFDVIYDDIRHTDKNEYHFPRLPLPFSPTPLGAFSEHEIRSLVIKRRLVTSSTQTHSQHGNFSDPPH